MLISKKPASDGEDSFCIMRQRNDRTQYTVCGSRPCAFSSVFYAGPGKRCICNLQMFVYNQFNCKLKSIAAERGIIAAVKGEPRYE